MPYAPDPYTLVDIPGDPHRVAITDQATGATIAVAGPRIAAHWIAWATGRVPTHEAVSLRLDASYRPCTCQHLAMAHRVKPAGLQPPKATGLGSGPCAVDGCTCTGLDPIQVTTTA